jgi:hypothetical protein
MLVMPGRKLREATAEDRVRQDRPVHEQRIVKDLVRVKPMDA